MADALTTTLGNVSGWIQRQRRQSEHTGYLYQNTGWPAQQGWKGAINSYISSLLTTGTPGEGPPLRARLLPKQAIIAPAVRYAGQAAIQRD